MYIAVFFVACLSYDVWKALWFEDAATGRVSFGIGLGTLVLAANVVLLYLPGLPLWTSLAVAFAARNSAIYFTKWYPEYRRIKYGAPPTILPAGN